MKQRQRAARARVFVVALLASWLPSVHALLVCSPAAGADLVIGVGEACTYGTSSWALRNGDIAGTVYFTGALNMTFTGNLTVRSSAVFDGRGGGYRPGASPVSPANTTVAPAAGGQHAGCADPLCTGVTGTNAAYGLTLQPFYAGTAGASLTIGGNVGHGGAGGAALRLAVNDTLRLAGTIDVRGMPGTNASGVWGGGGAGALTPC